jgi:hypothetical protein
VGWRHCVWTKHDGYGEADDCRIREDVDAGGDACVNYCIDLREDWMWKTMERVTTFEKGGAGHSVLNTCHKSCDDTQK